VGLGTLLAGFLAGCGTDRVSVETPIDPADAVSEDACDSAAFRGYGFDLYGGWKGIRREATGRFRVEQVDGVWWLITPLGHAFFSNGPTGVDIVGDYIQGTNRSPYLENNLEKHGSAEAWAASTSSRFCALGIRSLGGWMGAADLDRFAGTIPYAVNAEFYGAMPRLSGAPPSAVPRRDVFAPNAEELARQLAAPGGLIARCAQDPWCIGVYPENEAPYAPAVLAGGGHLEAYLAQPPGAPGKQEMQDFFTSRYGGDVQRFNTVWATNLSTFDDMQSLAKLGTCPPTLGYADDACYLKESPERIADRYAFEAHVAGHIAELADRVLDGANPGMLNLGPRIVVSPFAPVVLQALARPADIMSINNYDVRSLAGSLLTPELADRLAELDFLSFDPFERIRQTARITGKPILITEWFYRRARATGSFPPFLPEVPDGEAQAAAYRAYMEELLQMPFVVGEHWFQWVDQPIERRPDGENQLIGIVDIHDDLNQPLADAVADMNGKILERRLDLAAGQDGSRAGR